MRPIYYLTAFSRAASSFRSYLWFRKNIDLGLHALKLDTLRVFVPLRKDHLYYPLRNDISLLFTSPNLDTIKITDQEDQSELTKIGTASYGSVRDISFRVLPTYSGGILKSLCLQCGLCTPKLLIAASRPTTYQISMYYPVVSFQSLTNHLRRLGCSYNPRTTSLNRTYNLKCWRMKLEVHTGLFTTMIFEPSQVLIPWCADQPTYLLHVLISSLSRYHPKMLEKQTDGKERRWPYVKYGAKACSIGDNVESLHNHA